MVRPRSFASKKPKRGAGIDFKKIKHKIGRKLPPPKNATNTQVKSKAIVLKEQSVASERTGLAVGGRGLTLVELLKKSSHHSAKARRVALAGVRDLLVRCPSELKLHKLIIVEKLRERICDGDKAVRETLYQLLKGVVFPQLKEEIAGAVVSLMMAYLFNAMTHLAPDVRLMGFKFFHLTVMNHPPSFLLYAEQVLDCYGDIMRNMQLCLQDKSKVKDVLGGLLLCLSSITLKKDEVVPQGGEGNATVRPLHAFATDLPKLSIRFPSIIRKVEELLPFLINCFQELIAAVHSMPTIDASTFSCMLCILQIVNVALGFSVTEKDQSHRISSRLSIPCPFEGPDRSADVGNTSVHICLKKLWDVFPVCSTQQFVEKEGDKKYFILNIIIAEIFFQLPEVAYDTAVQKEKFLEFVESALYGQICRNRKPNTVIQEKHLVPVIQFIPSLVSQLTGYWKARLLQAFTSAFQNCRADSKLMLQCLYAVVQMLLPKGTQNMPLLDFNSEEMSCYQVAWLRKLLELLPRLGDKHPSVSNVILKLQLRIGQCSVPQSLLAFEYDNLQLTLSDLCSTYDDQGVRNHGPFVKLPVDCQEIAICSLYYFSSLNSHLVESLAFCCLCNDLKPIIPLRIIEVLHSLYKSGRLKLADHIAFLVTVVTRYEVSPEKSSLGSENMGMVSNHRTFKDISEAVLCCLSEIGDHSLVLKLLQKAVLEAMSLKPHLDNMQVLLRMIVLLDSRPSMLLEDNCSTLGRSLSAYLIDASHWIQENIDATAHNEEIRIYHFYSRPCVSILLRSDKVLYELLKSFSSYCGVDNDFEPNKVHAVALTIIFMLKDVRLHHNLSSSKEAVKDILQNICTLLSENRSKIALDKRQRLQSIFEQLKSEVGKLQGWRDVGVAGLEVS